MSDEATQLGIPEDAMRRLAEMKPGSPGALFTSDLTVNEFLLVREAGFHPLGLVLGSSIYHVGIQARRWTLARTKSSRPALCEAMYHARELAMTRILWRPRRLIALRRTGRHHRRRPGSRSSSRSSATTFAEFTADRHRR